MMQFRKTRSNTKSVGEVKKRNSSRTRIDRRDKNADECSSIANGDIVYQIGQEIGRGGFGVVFQALNKSSGDFVAVKRVALNVIDESALASIKQEINLLRKLNHKNIVQYIDSIQTKSHLFIILELMESSLASMCKKYGNFSESLTAIYMTQVLEGLQFLHEQGVLHRDIKGANILTTKNGVLKLADFGVATKLFDNSAIDDLDVVGTPYWMAPEIIEMKGATSACDIWSVGCTVIELITGKPPYYDLPQLSALYKIVQDDHPPLPNGISPMLRDFLLQCFMKEPTMRSSASVLLTLPWLKDPKNRIKKISNEKKSSRGKVAHDAILKPVQTFAKSERLLHESKECTIDEILDSTLTNVSEPAVAASRSGCIQPNSEEAWQHQRAMEGAENEQSMHEIKLCDISQDDLDGWDDDFIIPNEPVLMMPSDSQVQTEKSNLSLITLKRSGTLMSSHGMAVIDTEENCLEKFIETGENENTFDDFDIPDAALANWAVKPLAIAAVEIAGDPRDDPLLVDFEAELEEAEDRDSTRAMRDILSRDGHLVYCKLCELEEEVTESEIIEICNDVLSSLRARPEAKFYVFTPDHSAVPIVHMAHLDVPEARPILLSVVNELVEENPRSMDHLTLVGLLPKIIELARISLVERTAKAEELRTEVTRFIRILISSSEMALQMFISAGGLDVLVGLVRECHYMDPLELKMAEIVEVGIDSIQSVFVLQKNRRNEFCKLFIRLELLPSVTEVLGFLLACAIRKAKSITEYGTDILSEYSNHWTYLEACGNIFTTFSKSDGWVKERLVHSGCLKGILGSISEISADGYVQHEKFHSIILVLLTVIKNLSMEPNTLEEMANCNVFSTLIPVLYWEEDSYDKDIESQVIQSMFYLCRISRKRQEIASAAGLVPCLQRCIEQGTLVEQFALQILCDLAHNGSLIVRDILLRHNCFSFFINIISSPKDKHWFLADTERVVKNLANPSALSSIIHLFCTAKKENFEIVVKELDDMMVKSPQLVKALGMNDDFVQELKVRLHYPKAVVAKSLIGMLQLIYRNHPRPRGLDRKFSLYQTITKLAKNKMQVLVAEMASQLLADIDELGGKYGI